MKNTLLWKLVCVAMLIALSLVLHACIQSTELSSHNSDLYTDPTKQATDPTEQATDPTQPSVQPTEPEPWSHEAELTRFLTEVNQSGEIAPEDVPPGGWPSVEAIPTADQSMVGSTVEIILAQRQQQIPFFYIYNAETGWERLAVVIIAEKIPLMLVMETELGGISELCEKIANEEVFSAKICSATNISNDEARNVVEWCYILPETQRLDVLSGNVPNTDGMYIGTVGSAYLNGKLVETVNQLAILDPVNDTQCAWLRIFTRFGLKDIVFEN